MIFIIFVLLASVGIMIVVFGGLTAMWASIAGIAIGTVTLLLSIITKALFGIATWELSYIIRDAIMDLLLSALWSFFVNVLLPW